MEIELYSGHLKHLDVHRFYSRASAARLATSIILAMSGSTREKLFLKRLSDAFVCLIEVGLVYRRIRATAHEYEVRYANRRQAVRITLERQWSYQYLFVQFYRRNEGGEWIPVSYLDSWLAQQGWEQEAILALLKCPQPVMSLSDAEQVEFLEKAAKVVCASARQIFG